MKVLIIEDNAILRDNIKKYLEIQKFQVETHDAYTGASYKIILG
jgi:DNA-binding response OmpR family regulator